MAWKIVVRKQNGKWAVFGVVTGLLAGKTADELLEGGFFTFAAAEGCAKEL